MCKCNIKKTSFCSKSSQLISHFSKEISERTRWLLRKVATGACYLQPFEIERAVTYILPKEKKLAKNIILSIVAKTKVMEPLKHAKRKVLVLIVDEVSISNHLTNHYNSTLTKSI